MMKRKPLSKMMRRLVYEKYNGHCAYCGKEIDMKAMQVDHIIPMMYAEYGTKEHREAVQQMIVDGRMDSIDNLMPACRACNFYKSMNDLEHFRRRISDELDRSCRSTFQTRLAMQYGMIKYEPWDGKFWFERFEGDK